VKRFTAHLTVNTPIHTIQPTLC